MIYYTIAPTRHAKDPEDHRLLGMLTALVTSHGILFPVMVFCDVTTIMTFIVAVLLCFESMELVLDVTAIMTSLGLTGDVGRIATWFCSIYTMKRRI